MSSVVPALQSKRKTYVIWVGPLFLYTVTNDRRLNTTKPTMALVQYPDSDSDEPDKTHATAAHPLKSVPTVARKRKLSSSAQDDLPPLPAAFHDLYTTNARIGTSDNPELHGGRKRAVPHVEGNWPSHVYLECKDATA